MSIGKFHKEDSVIERTTHKGGHLIGQPSFPDTTHSSQRNKTVCEHGVPNLLNLLFPSNETSQKLTRSSRHLASTNSLLFLLNLPLGGDQHVLSLYYI